MARRRARELAVSLEGRSVPAELLDPDHLTWTSPESTDALANALGLEYTPCPADRLRGPGTHPQNRRNSFAEAWAVANGVATTTGAGSDPSPDLHRLAAMGLYG
jgi:hypothetical protein